MLCEGEDMLPIKNKMSYTHFTLFMWDMHATHVWRLEDILGKCILSFHPSRMKVRSVNLVSMACTH